MEQTKVYLEPALWAAKYTTDAKPYFVWTQNFNWLPMMCWGYKIVSDIFFRIWDLDNSVSVFVSVCVCLCMCHHNLICHWHQTIWATEMCQTFLECWYRTHLNGAHYVGGSPPKNAQKHRKPPKNIIFGTFSVCHLLLIACWRQTVWATEMCQTFLEFWDRAVWM